MYSLFGLPNDNIDSSLCSSNEVGMEWETK